MIKYENNWKKKILFSVRSKRFIKIGWSVSEETLQNKKKGKRNKEEQEGLPLETQHFNKR